MKHLLRQKANFEILEGFLSVLLQEQVTIDQVLESANNAVHKNSKHNCVDLLVRSSPLKAKKTHHKRH